MRLLLAAMRCEKGHPEVNLAAHLDQLAKARGARCDLAVFPEMSLTGSVDPVRHPERAVTLDDPTVGRLVDGTRRTAVAAVFGIGEHRDGEHWITQVYACAGRILGVQRKRHLGEDEKGFSVSTETSVFELGAARFGSIICAETSVDHTWDASVAAGAQLLLVSSAPGLTGRRADDAAWRAGYDWWESAGLADAQRHARRLGVWVAMATQAGSTADEDFPGIAALIAPDGAVVARLPDWRPGTLAVDLPLTGALLAQFGDLPDPDGDLGR